MRFIALFIAAHVALVLLMFLEGCGTETDDSTESGAPQELLGTWKSGCYQDGLEYRETTLTITDGAIIDDTYLFTDTDCNDGKGYDGRNYRFTATGSTLSTETTDIVTGEVIKAEHTWTIEGNTLTIGEIPYTRQ